MDIKDLLDRRWVHSHEEDGGGVRVFRPEDFAFPRSRGRTAFTLNDDGTAILEPPSPTDRGSRTLNGHWALDNDAIIIVPDEDGAKPLRVDVAAGALDRITTVKS